MATEKLITCSQHPDEEALLTCGECGKRICTRCMTLTGEGVRCPECMARLNSHYSKPNQADNSGWTREPEQIIIPAEEIPQTESSSKAETSSGPQLIDINPVTGEPSTDITFCRRHPKVETGLRCNRCNAPICPRCMVYTSVGLRCPDCAQQSMPKSSPASPNRNSRPVERDTGFRTYWRRTPPHYEILPQHYALAGLAAVGAALLGGIIWGFLLDANAATGGVRVTGNAIQIVPRVFSTVFTNSIQIVPEILLGVLVGEAVARATRDRRGRGLQFIAIAGVVLGYMVALATLIVRALNIRVSGAGFPALGDLISLTWQSFTGTFSGSAGISMLLFFVVGAAFAWMRLRQ